MEHTLTARSGGTFRKLFVCANTRVEKRQIYGAKLFRVASTNPEQKQLGHVVKEVDHSVVLDAQAGMIPPTITEAAAIGTKSEGLELALAARLVPEVARPIAGVLRAVANATDYFENGSSRPLDRTSHWPNTLTACSRDVVEHVEDHDAREIVWAAVVACCHRLAKGRDDDRLNVGGGCHGPSLRPAPHPVQGNSILLEGGTQEGSPQGGCPDAGSRVLGDHPPSRGSARATIRTRRPGS
jgi:hypothetical protein